MYRRAPGFGFRPTYAGYGQFNARNRDTYREQQVIRVLLALAQQIMMMERKPPVTLLLVAGEYVVMKMFRSH